VKAFDRSGREKRVMEERERDVHFGEHGWVSTRVIDRDSLGVDAAVEGPCIVEELDSTVVLPPGTSAVVDAVGNIVITLHESGEANR
jgi:N-methylhydantoinase A